MPSNKRNYRFNPHQQQQNRCTPYEPRTITLHSSQFKEKREKLKDELDILHRKKHSCRGDARKQLSAEINRKVEVWNTDFMQKETNFDLHWMTPEAAVEFVGRMVEKKNGHGKFELIVGKGLHSKNSTAAIKTELLKEYEGKDRCLIKEMEGNSGCLVLDLW